MLRPVAAFLPPIVFLASFTSFAVETTVELRPIVKDGTPGEVLMQDPVVPVQHGAPTLDSASGTIQKNLTDEIPMSVTGTGSPGSIAQFRGLGRSAENTDVQTLGVPLNPPQGGGFDLSIFPQFIWSGFEYQPGPALGTFDPRGTAGSLTLVPWSAQALNQRGMIGRAGIFYSTAELNQIFVAGTNGQSLAAIVGNSTGEVHGPSLAFSGRWAASDRAVFSFHLLGTDVDAKSPDRSTPNAHTRTSRVIPLAQIDLPVGDRGLLKSSVYYDWNYIRYDDPAFSSFPLSQDRIQQLGSENVLLLGAWKLGLGGRGVRYQTLSFGLQEETSLHLQASRTFEPGDFLIEPTVRGVGMATYGILPEASVGVRRESRLEGGARAWFGRIGYSRQFPSLMNRFYEYPAYPGVSQGFKGNPSLQPERNWTAILGTELKTRLADAAVQVFTQFSQDVQVRVPLDAQTYTIANRGNARVASLMPSFTLRPLGWLDLYASATLSASEVSQTGLAYSGLPGFFGVTWARVHSGESWETRAICKASSTAVADAAGNRLPAYQEVALDGRVRVGGHGLLSARLENLLNEEIVLVKGYPSLGRTFSVFGSIEI